MRYLSFILITLLFLTIASFAEECSEQHSPKVTLGEYVIDTNVPKHLRGATITITRADGKTSTVPAEQFKVVPRKQQFITKETLWKSVTTCRADEKNRISVLGGAGVQEGIKRTQVSATHLQAESNVGFVGGLQFQRKISKSLSLGVQVQTNKTGSGVLGLDF